MIAHNLARWTARLGLGEDERAVWSRGRSAAATSPCPAASPAAPAASTLHLPARWPWRDFGGFTQALARLRAMPLLA